MTTPKLRLFQVDAFTERLFSGNPAAVCPLETWLPDHLLQAVAAENNLSETAFFVADGDAFDLRWFTPTAEVQLCGHATLASAYVLFECLGHTAETIIFKSRFSGELRVRRDGKMLWLDLPAQAAAPEPALPEALQKALAQAPNEWLAGPNYMAVYSSESQVAALAPDMRVLATLENRCLIVTAPADAPGVDFVSRFFAPNFGIDEDPVTGSAHCMLAPYWSARLGKTHLNARQISPRGGVLQCELQSDRVYIGGHAVLYMQAEVFLPESK